MDQPPAPAAPTLRPLGIGDIVDRTVTLYRGSPVLFVLLAFVPYVVFAVLAIPIGAALFAGGAFSTPRTTFDPTNPFPFTGPQLGAIAGSLIAVFLLVVIVFSAQAAALVDAFAKRHLGRPAAVRSSLAAGLRASVRLIFATIVASIVFGVALIAGSIVIGIVSAIVRIGLVSAIGVIALVVGAFYLVASFMAVPAVVTVEGAGPIVALRRSWRLADGSRWRIIGLLLLLLVIFLVIELLVVFLLLGLLATSGVLQVVLNQVVSLAVSVLITPLQWGVFTILYYDLRVRKEALDLHLAAEALPRDT